MHAIESHDLAMRNLRAQAPGPEALDKREEEDLAGIKKFVMQYGRTANVDKSASVRTALRTSTSTSLFKLAAAPRELADKHVEIKLTYNAAYGRPDRKDIQAYVAREFPSTEIAEVLNHNTGLMTLVLRAQVAPQPENVQVAFNGTDETYYVSWNLDGHSFDVSALAMDIDLDRDNATIMVDGTPVELPWEEATDIIEIAYRILQNHPTFQENEAFDETEPTDAPPCWCDESDHTTDCECCGAKAGEPCKHLQKGAQMDPGNLPAGTAAHPLPGGDKRGPAVGEEIEGTGVIGSKEAQAAPPQDNPNKITIVPATKGGFNLVDGLGNELGWAPTEAEAKQMIAKLRRRWAQAAPPPPPDPVEMAQEQGAVPGSPESAQAVPPEGSADLAPADSGMSLEQALQQLTEAAEAVRQKVEQGDAIVHGQEVTPADDAPPSTTPPVAAEPAGAAPVQAKKAQIPPPWMIEELEKVRKQKEQRQQPRPQLPAPQPPSGKGAVDPNAKQYYHDYYGEYGDEMTREVPNAVEDRMAMVLVEAEATKVALTDDQVLTIVALLQKRPEVHGAFERYAQMGGEPSMDQMVAMAMELSQSDRSVAKILDKMTIQYLIKTSDALNRMTPQEQQVILERAVRSNPHLYKKLLRLYNKHLGVPEAQSIAPAQPEIMMAAMKITAAGMKEPKVKGQPDDAVDVIKLEDVATDDHVVPAGHIPMTYSDPVVKGVYTYITVSWDSDDAHVSGQSLVLAIRRFVVNTASNKETIDWGLIGPVHIDDVDPQAGVATVHFRTSKPGNAPLQVQSKE